MSRRGLLVATCFGGSLLVLLVAGGWMTRRALALEREQMNARTKAATEQRVQLALWRMDSALNAWLALEGARSLTDYLLDPPAEPELAPPAELVRYRFVGAPYEAPRQFHSYGVPDGPAPPKLAALAAALDAAAGRTASQLVEPESAEDPELASRRKNLLVQQQGAFSIPAQRPRLLETPLTGIWVDTQLLLVRRVRIGRRQELQGAALDIAELQRWLGHEAGDLVAGARLLPVEPGDGDESRRLALLPLRLEPSVDDFPDAGPSELHRGLLFAWSAGLMAVAAAGVLLGSALLFAERRSAFVSAVTHELRTPLTTFQLYTDLLSQNRVPPEQRSSYLETLRGEAGRLHHLVDNVLDLARLERRGGGEATWMGAGELLEPLLLTLRRRISTASRQLLVEGTVDPGVEVLAHPTAVERVLANLVDNALRHAASEDPRLHLSISRDGRLLRLALRDHGPGVSPERRHRLFRAFHKSARQAAETTSGVGLGLALSRRLARRMKGDLRLAGSSGSGASFELLLRCR